MKRYRTKIGIVYDILKIIDEEKEIRITKLLSRANLSYSRLQGYIDFLEKNGLIKKENEFYKITDKGLNFLREYKKFESFVEAFGLEL